MPRDTSSHSPATAGCRWRLVRIIGAIAVLMTGLPIGSPPVAAQTPTPTPRPAVAVEIASDGFRPSTVVAVPDQPVEFTNTSGVVQRIVGGPNEAPTFDSGPIPPGGRFVAAFDAGLRLTFRTEGDPAFSGTLLITQPGLSGERTALARSAITNLDPPVSTSADLSPHPDYGLMTSRTTFLVLPTTTATVGEVNDAIAAIDGSIVAGMALLGTIGVAIADTGDFSTWQPALDQLRVAPGIQEVAAVWENGTDTVPAPTNLGTPYDEVWSAVPPPASPPCVPDSPPCADQWGLRAVRAPQAWNTLAAARESVVDQGTGIDTVVLDLGFGAHPDVPFASINANRATDHGMIDAGIIGASYANPGGAGRTEGVVGIDPLSKLHGVAFTVTPSSVDLGPGEVRAYTTLQASASFNAVLSEKRTGGRYPRLGVISASFGVAAFSNTAADWVTAVAGRTCNPGPADDPTSGLGGTEPCSPENQDVFIREIGAVATVYAAQVLSVAKALDVVIAKSAGNSNDMFCQNGLQIMVCENIWPYAQNPQTQIPLSAESTNEFIVARRILNQALPLLVVGAIGPTGDGASVGAPVTFSQGGPGVDVVAPGQDILSTTVNEPAPGRILSSTGAYYEHSSGTSMATPHVAGAVAYLRSMFPLTAIEVVDTIRSTTASVAFGARLDMWAAVVSEARGRIAIADQNDASVDGNERVQRTINDAPGAALDWVPNDPNDSRNMNTRLGPRRADPDSTVNMKDIRAFRDAWLQTCVDGSSSQGGAGVGLLACPNPPDVSLDGLARSWKRDGNLDGCVNPGVDALGTSPCGDPTPLGTFVYSGEARNNRWDLNGDGFLAPAVAAPVPFDTANQFSPGGTSMTDLEVLSTVLTPSSSFEGWTRSQLQAGGLRDLMTSADVQIRFDRFGSNGAPFTGTVDVYVDYGSGRLERKDFFVGPSSNELMMTVPVTASGAPLKVWVVGGVRRSAVIEIANALPGEDIVVAPREAKLEVKLGVSQLVENSGTGVKVRLADIGLGLNDGQMVAGDVTLTVSGLTPGAPVLGSATLPLDELAFTTLTAGATTGIGTVRAELTLPTGEKISGTATFEVLPGITIRYAHRSVMRSYDFASAGTTRWTDVALPDCTRIPYVCVDELTAQSASGATPFSVTRTGTLTMRASGFTVTEQVTGGSGLVTYAYRWTDVDATTGSASTTFAFSPRASERNRYVDQPLNARFSIENNKAQLVGIQALSDLGYISDLSRSTSPFSSPDTGAVNLPREFLMAPDPTGDNLYIGDRTRPVSFTRPTPTGQWAPFVACARRTVDLTDTPGYEAGTPDQWVPGAQSIERDRVYDAGDIPQPVQQSALVFVTGFAATLATDGSQPAEPVPPPCTGAGPPEADFTVSDARGVPLGAGGEIKEGEVVRFLELATDPDANIVDYAWTFGDGRSSIVTDPVIGGYADDGLYTVTLTVTDLEGNTDTETKQIRVVNQKPTITALVPVTTVTAGERAKVQFLVDDAGRTDRRALAVSVSGAPTWIPAANREAGLVTVDVEVLTADTIISATVRDPQSAASETASVRVVVAAEPAPPPPCPGSPLCPPQPVSIRLDAPLDAKERAVFNLVDAARRSAGLPVLPISAELNAVANVAARGMHAGAAPDLSGAIAASGYPAVASVTWVTVTLDANAAMHALSRELLMVADPSAQMLGIARIGLVGGIDTYAVVIGDILDADVTRPTRGDAPTLSMRFPPTGLSEGLDVAPTIAATDPDSDLTAIDIDWGDGSSGGRTHRFRDSGTYTVTAVAIDEQLNRTVVSTTVVVANSAPELTLSVLGLDGGPPTSGADAILEATVLDWAEADRPLTLILTSTLPGLSFSGPVSGSRFFTFRPPGAGSFSVTATLSDADGGVAAPPVSTTMPFSFTVGTSPNTPPLPPNVTVPAAPCDAGVIVSSQSAAFLGLFNTYRGAQGGTALVLDPALQAAAQAHLNDLVANRSFSHRGTDNSDPATRARRAGYLGGVGENLTVGPTTAQAALASWRMSPPHHTNMLRPWRATGIAVGNSAFGPLWVQVFGDAASCTGTAPAVSPIVLRPPSALGGTPQIGVLPWPEAATLQAAAPAVPAVATTASIVAQAPAPPPPPDVRVLAYTVDRVSALTGQLVRVTNRSRDAGTPVAARVLLPGGGNVVAQPDTSVSLSWFQPGSGTATVSVQSMTWDEAFLLSTRVGLTGDELPPTISISATPTSVPRGGSVSVVATVTDPGGAPLAGRTVRADAAMATATGTTGDDGTATISLVMQVPAGSYQVGASVLDDTGAPVAVAAPRGVAVTEHIAPTAITTGPYLVNLGDTVGFDASPSMAVPPAAVASAVWDLDGDGSFGDLAALTTAMPFPQVQRLMCAGVCSTDRSYPVAVRVTDSVGASSTVSTTVRFARDFGLMLGPQIQTIRPGEQTTFTVSALTTSGFDEPIDLTMVGLPAGVTASFTPTRINPGQSSVLTISLASTLTGVDTLPLTVRGTSTGRTVREASPTVSVVFGLVPVCLGTVSGTIRDVRTGAPISGATVSALSTTVLTGADGTFMVGQLPLWNANQRGGSWFSVSKDGFWNQAAYLEYRCGQPQTWNADLVDVRRVTIRWAVREGARDPSRPTQLIATDGIPAGAELRPVSRPLEAIGESGFVTATYDLGSGNSPTHVYADATAPGYVTATSGWVQLDSSMVGRAPIVRTILMPRPCSTSVLRGKIVGPEGQPAPGSTTIIEGIGYVGDELGEFDIDQSIRWPTNHGLWDWRSVTATPTDAQFADGWRAATHFAVLQCEDTIALVTLRLGRNPTSVPPPAPERITTIVTGTITDIDTGLPIPDAYAWVPWAPADTTDANGNYRAELVTDGPAGFSRTANLYASATSYYSDSTPSVPFRVGAPVTIDLALLRVRTGALEGVVRDLATGLPIPGAKVTNPNTGAITTVGDDGRFRFENMSLGSRNTPSYPTIRGSATGYWDRWLPVEVRQDQEGFLDLGMLRECVPATVSGLVIDAVTREPLDGASITGSFAPRTTGPDGKFTISDIRMQAQNTPWQQSMTAARTGYVTQTKSVNVFCGATVQVVYGPASNNPGTVTGTVTDATTGTPLSGVFVGSDWGGSATTDSSGRYTIDQAPPNGSPSPDDWQVTAQRTFDSDPGRVNYAPASQRVSIGPGETKQVDLALGRLSTPNQFPVARLAEVTDAVGGTAFTLDASSSSDPDDDPITFDWDLDADGLFDDAAGATTTLTLDAGTTRRVAVRVTDSRLLTGVARRTVVTAAPPTTTSTTTSTTSTTTTTTVPPTTTSTTTTTVAPTTTTSSTTSTTTVPPSTSTASTTTTTTVPPSMSTTTTTVAPDTTAVNRGPTASIAGTLEIVEGASTVLTSTSTDPDGDLLSFEWRVGGLPAGSSLSSLEVRGVRYGTQTVALTVSDGRGASDRVEAEVRIMNAAPRVNLSSVPTDIARGIPTSVVMEADDVGVDTLVGRTGPPGATVPLALMAQSPPPVTGSAASGELVLPTDQLGPVTIRIEVCDSEPACTEKLISYTVIEPMPENRPPTVVLSAPAQVDAGAMVDVVAQVTDPDEDPVSITWFVDDELQTGTGDRLSFPSGPAGTRTVRVEVRDGHHDTSVVASTTIEVLATGPTMTAWGPPSAVVGDTWPLSLSMSDPIADQFDATIDWGDGTVESATMRQSMSSGTGLSSVGALTVDQTIPHVYRAAGDYVVTIEACSIEQRCARATVAVSVAAASPVVSTPTTTTTIAPSASAPPTTVAPESGPATVPATVSATTIAPSTPVVDVPAPRPGSVPTATVPGGGLPSTGADSRNSMVIASALVALGTLVTASVRLRRPRR